MNFNLEQQRAQYFWWTESVPGMDWTHDAMHSWSMRYASVQDGNDRTPENFPRMVKNYAKMEGAIADVYDPAFIGNEKASMFAQRLRRHHIMVYSCRLFASPESSSFDMPWWIPQYIGKQEIDNSLKLRGYLMPDDEAAHEYYSNRRLEANAVEVWGQTSMYKSGLQARAALHPAPRVAQSCLHRWPRSRSVVLPR